MEREARPFRRLKLRDIDIVVSGVGAVRAAEAAERLPAETRKVTVAGFCGALDPSLKIGDVVVSDDHDRAILTVDAIVATPIEKARLFRTTAARAVDMESAAIFEVCRRRGIACQAIRAVSDTAHEELPADLANLLNGGTVSPLAAIKLLVRRPSALYDFRRLARNTKIAAANLARYLEAD
jgi:adenosylhomocysteine nucleosidase